MRVIPRHGACLFVRLKVEGALFISGMTPLMSARNRWGGASLGMGGLAGRGRYTAGGAGGCKVDSLGCSGFGSRGCLTAIVFHFQVFFTVGLGSVNA